MSSELVAFLIGPSPSIGPDLIATWKQNGYRIVVGSRSIDEEKERKEGNFPVKIDVTNSSSIVAAFETVTRELGPPNIVVYNAVYFTKPDDSEDPLASLQFESFQVSNAVASATFLIAQESLKTFRSPVHASHVKSFIVTGNILPFVPATGPVLFCLALQKKIAAHVVEQLYQSYTEGKKGTDSIRFHFAHLASTDGKIPPFPQAVFKASGKAHAKAYWHLSNSEEPEDWDYRFGLEGDKL